MFVAVIIARVTAYKTVDYFLGFMVSKRSLIRWLSVYDREILGYLGKPVPFPAVPAPHLKTAKAMLRP